MASDERNDYKVILTLNPDQCRLLQYVCELYMRMHIGQMDRLAEDLVRFDPDHTGEEWDHYIQRLEVAKQVCAALKTIAYPSLVYPGQSRNAEPEEWANEACDIWQVLRYTQAWHENPQGGYSVNFHKPLKKGAYPLPTCEIVEVNK